MMGKAKTVYEVFKMYNFVINDFFALFYVDDRLDGNVSSKQKNCCLLPTTSFGLLLAQSITTHYRLTILPVVVCLTCGVFLSIVYV